jgi:hypothetical protein
METTPPIPLALSLNPVLALRAPDTCTPIRTLGFQLRLPDGPALASDDPLLRVFGASVVAVIAGPDDREALQDDAFAPGRRVSLLEEGVDEDGDPIVGVWDADGVRRAGNLHYETAAAVSAGIEAGLGVEAVVLTEDRTRVDDRRAGLELLVHAPALVRVETAVAASAPPVRLARPSRERVVLVADGRAEPRWWDPAGRRGPMELEQVPLSPGLLADLSTTAAAYALVSDDDAPTDAIDGFEREMHRSSLEARMRELWQRARAELGRTYAIGLLGPGMTRPEWTPAEDHDDDDIPF